VKLPLSVEIGRPLDNPHEVERVSAVIVCVGYSDFLVESLKVNTNQLDEIYVVTHPEDIKTQQICRYYSVNCLPTEVVYERNVYFNKAGAINYGLLHLPQKGYWLHMDADILLAPGFRRQLEAARLNKQVLYGADRFNVVGWDAYQELLKSDEWTNQWSQGCAMSPHPKMPMGGREVDSWGYSPIGYFQLWHHGVQRKYTSSCGHAGNDDVIFALQWAADNRRVLPTALVYHLMSVEPAASLSRGAVLNWWGRKSPLFCDPATLPPQEPAIELMTVAQAAYEAMRVYLSSLDILEPEWDALSDEVKVTHLNRAKWVLEHPKALQYDEASNLTTRRAQVIFARAALGFKR